MDFLPSDNEIDLHTNWLDFRNNDLSTFCTLNAYLKNISHLMLSNNRIGKICHNTTDFLRKGRLKALDLSQNDLKRLPRNIVNVSYSTELWLSRNPYLCNCDTLWLKDWIFNKSGQTIVQDSYDVKCSDNVPMNQIDAVEMGCFPKELTLWQKILIGMSATVTIGVVIAIIAISKRWNEVKWFMYLHFDVLDKNDGNENLENKKSDIFVSYKYV